MTLNLSLLILVILAFFPIGAQALHTNNQVDTFTYFQQEKAATPIHKRPWIGRDFWANRLQDWQLNIGRLECLQSSTTMPLRTVHILTHQLNDKKSAFELSVRTGMLGLEWHSENQSFSGFLIGAGAGKLNYKSASLVHHYSGKGGGILAVIDEDGNLAFRKNNDNEQLDTYPKIETITRNGKSYPRQRRIVNWEDIQLKLKAEPLTDNKFKLTLQAYNYHSQTLIQEVSTEIDSRLLQGNIALVSHPGQENGKRYWFRDFSLTGDKITYSPQQQLGPVYNVFYSRSKTILKLTAQFPPLGFGDNTLCELQIAQNGKWQTLAKTTIQTPSFTAQFRLEDFGYTTDKPFRIAYDSGKETTYFNGIIKAEPDEKEEIKVAGFTCYQVLGIPADNSWGASYAGASKSRWLPKNLWFPHNDMMAHIKAQAPDLLVFLGDQLYEGGNPTNSDIAGANPSMDYFYKYFIFLWDFNQVTNHFPSIVLTDDHDIFQGDLWGNGGTASLDGNNKSGGFVHEPEFVNMVETTQTSHNPDLFDPTPIKQNIGVYYGGFEYGGIGIAFLEDRKFKSLPSIVGGGDVAFYGSKVVSGISNEALDVEGATLVGDRQLHFLDSWLKNDKDILMRLVVTQTIFASLHTTPNGEIWRDLDSGGWPQSGRERVLKQIRKGHAVIMGGDTHLPALVQHGTDNFNDASYQLIVPAVSNKYRRWWSPSKSIKKANGQYLDGLGNKVSVLAVGNPTIENQMVDKANRALGNTYGSEHVYLNQDSLRNGYGIIKFDKNNLQVTFEAWDMQRKEQMPGWPYTIDIAENYMASLPYKLPDIKIKTVDFIKVSVMNTDTGEFVYSLTSKESTLHLKVPQLGNYKVIAHHDGQVKTFILKAKK